MIRTFYHPECAQCAVPLENAWQDNIDGMVTVCSVKCREQVGTRLLLNGYLVESPEVGPMKVQQQGHKLFLGYDPTYGVEIWEPETFYVLIKETEGGEGA